MEREARSCATERARSWSRRTAPHRWPRRGHPDGFGFVVPRRARPVPRPAARDAQGAPRRPRLVSQSGVDQPRPAPRRRSSKCSSGFNTRVVGRLNREHGFSSFQPSEAAHQPEHPRRGEDAAARARAGGVRRAQPCSPTPHEPVGRIVEVLGRSGDPGIEIEIALRKHDLPFKFSAPPNNSPRNILRSGAGDLLAGARPAHPELVTIDGETARDFVRRGLLREEEGRFSASSSPSPTSATTFRRRRRARQGGARRRHSVYFPRRVIPMLPEKCPTGCVAQPGRRAPVHGLRHGDRSEGQIGKYRFTPR